MFLHFRCYTCLCAWGIPYGGIICFPFLIINIFLHDGIVWHAAMFAESFLLPNLFKLCLKVGYYKKLKHSFH